MRTEPSIYSRLAWLTAGFSLAILSCTQPPPASPSGGLAVTERGSAQEKLPPPTPLQERLSDIEPTRPLPPSDAERQLTAAIDAYFQSHLQTRVYLSVDKPLYHPGEALWFRAWTLATPTLTSQEAGWVNAQLLTPRGSLLAQKRIRVTEGVARNDLVIPAGSPGGEYKLVVRGARGGMGERTVVVSSYQPPRLKKKVELLRKAYGPGDEVAAAVSLARATGEVLAEKRATALAVVDGIEVARKTFVTSEDGNAIVKFALPKTIARGDGLLTILVEDGGVTESIQKRIPIITGKLNLALYPEGGDLVSGLPGRVYFAAKNTLGKPADIEGRVVTEDGREVARIRSLVNGMGRFELTPHAGETYHVEITRPVGIEMTFPVPAAKSHGCALVAVDDFSGERGDVRVAVWCTDPREVIATASLRDKRIGDVAAKILPGVPTVISIPVPPGRQGAARVTLFDGEDGLTPLAERLVYRGLGRDLRVEITADRERYTPRAPVTLTIKTTDTAGRPVNADLALSVVDDSVLAFADDKTAHMLAAIYLESEMPGQKIHEPNDYFTGTPKAARGIDLVLGTQGWRRFAWQQVFNRVPPRPVSEAAAIPMPKPAPPPAGLRPRAPRRAAKDAKVVVAKKKIVVVRGGEMEKRVAPQLDRQGADELFPRRDRACCFGAAAGAAAGPAQAQVAAGWAAVREFPVPSYEPDYDGPRTDFRETIYWNGAVKTDGGKAKVTFFVSDAVTSFRAIAEGISAGGLPGRGETLIQSVLPVSIAVKMPLEVSAGDRIELPITLANNTGQKQVAAFAASFGPAFELKNRLPATVELAAGERKSVFAQLEVVGNGASEKDGTVEIHVRANNLKDEVKKVIRVVPLGFPQQAAASGTVDKTVRHELTLDGALPGTITAQVTLYPSPLATMIQGTQAIIREPYGCFEQASSANYPNIMVLSYLEEHNAADPALVARTGAILDRGYQKIAGYESPKHGYEWFGGDPGHEALTAYGLMEFYDMKEVYGGVSKPMVARTQRWLLSRRDGKGGFKRNARALDSFGRASEVVTNGYIAYALSETGMKKLAPELAYQKRIAAKTTDPYVMALAANVLVNLEPQSPTTRAAVARLAGMQDKDGGFSGADHSITRSGGVALSLETTALAAMALMKADTDADAVRKAIAWIHDHQNGYGGFGSTQSTVLALKALAMYAESSRRTQAGGTVWLTINGKRAGRVAFEKGQTEPLVFDDIARFLHPGKNVVELRLDSEITLPYSIAIDYRSTQPATSPEAAVAIATDLAKSKVPVGESVRMNVTVENVTEKGIPMVLARVGLPGGLTFQTWQLKELREKKIIDFYETREREVILYFRSMAPGAKKSIPLELLARVPGSFVGPASRAYLYYTDEHKHWEKPATVTVTR